MRMPYNKKLIANAKKLRNEMTEEEDKLWYQYLSRYPVRFLRQKVIANYILDFYCAKYKLGIEVDGGQHQTEQGIGHDNARTELLNAYGIEIIRFTNDQVRTRFNQICRLIDEKVSERIQQFSLDKELPTRP